MTSDTSHGWVKPRPDGGVAKCGGPGLCSTCTTEQMHETMLNGLFGQRDTPFQTGQAQPATNREPYGSPADVARRIENWISKHGKHDTPSLLLYEAMKALRAQALAPVRKDSTC